MDSIAFDRAAEYYDRTRELAPETQAAVIGLLAEQVRGRGRCLEIGVGTGRMALDLQRAGVPMTGVDLSEPMLRKLVQKAGGSVPFPLAIADATALPFPGAVFGAAIVCHVLHLIAPWRLAAEELIRTLRPGGVILVDPGGGAGGASREISDHFFSHTAQGVRRRPGLTDIAELDDLALGRGLDIRVLPQVKDRATTAVEEVVRRLEAGMYAACWSIGAEELSSAGAATREWAGRRFGSLDHPVQLELAIRWRAYDLPARG